MKQTVLALSFILAAARLASAGPCVTGSLADYIALGPDGCTIGANTVANFTILIGISGADPISPADLTISPLADTFHPGLQTSTDTSASAGDLLEAFFRYDIFGSTYVASAITLGGSSESGDGAVSYVQNFCAGGVFALGGLSDCTGIPGDLVTLDGTQNQDSAALGPVSFLNVTDDLVFDGGLAGSASGGLVSDRFTAVPEPSTFLFMGLGLAFTMRLAWRALRLNSSGN